LSTFQGFQNHMLVVARQATGMHLPAGLLARFGLRLEEIGRANAIQEDSLTSIPTTHDMAPGGGMLHVQVARQKCGRHGNQNPWSTKNQLNMWLTHFPPRLQMPKA
jgi:hypothetical protein